MADFVFDAKRHDLLNVCIDIVIVGINGFVEHGHVFILTGDVNRRDKAKQPDFSRRFSEPFLDGNY